MLGTRFLSVTLILLLLSAQNLQAQSGDWHMAESLQAGTLISVRSKHRVKCRFARATDDALSCEIIRSGLAGTVMKRAPILFLIVKVFRKCGSSVRTFQTTLVAVASLPQKQTEDLQEKAARAVSLLLGLLG